MLQRIRDLAVDLYVQHKAAIKEIEAPCNARHIAALENCFENVLDALNGACPPPVQGVIRDTLTRVRAREHVNATEATIAVLEELVALNERLATIEARTEPMS